MSNHFSSFRGCDGRIFDKIVIHFPSITGRFKYQRSSFLSLSYQRKLKFILFSKSLILRGDFCRPVVGLAEELHYAIEKTALKSSFT